MSISNKRTVSGGVSQSKLQHVFIVIKECVSVTVNTHNVGDIHWWYLLVCVLQ